MHRIAVYPGTFDPITNGHIDIIKRASALFDKVYVAIADSGAKGPLFDMDERVSMAKAATSELPNVAVERFGGLVVDYVRSKKSKVVLRGLRMISDFEYEFQMALTNRKLAGDIETIFMMPNECYSYLASKLIKEATALGADVSCFVPDVVVRALKRKISKNG
jgi:pantetheine-phosphate adenylyltransferase